MKAPDLSPSPGAFRKCCILLDKVESNDGGRSAGWLYLHPHPSFAAVLHFGLRCLTVLLGAPPCETGLLDLAACSVWTVGGMAEAHCPIDYVWTVYVNVEICKGSIYHVTVTKSLDNQETPIFTSLLLSTLSCR